MPDHTTIPAAAASESLDPSPQLSDRLSWGTRMSYAQRIVGSGQMADLTRSHPWQSTPLGAIDGWPECLVWSVNLMLACRFPCVIFWGPEMIQFYNDAYLPLMAEKHPAALGMAARDCWKEAWHIIGPQFDATLLRGETTFQENVLVPVNRDGHLQDVYWTYSYSPLYGAGPNVTGVFIVCHDTTSEVLSSRARQEAQEELRAERAGLAELFDQAPTFIAVLRGPEHVFAMCNPAYQRLIGNRTILGKRVIDAVPEAEAQGYIALLDQVYRSGEHFVSHNSRLLVQQMPDEPMVELYLDFVYQPKLDHDGKVSGIIVLGVDVTERRRAEQALMQSEKLAAVGRLASSIAHEINNPLESVTNLLYLARGSEGVPPDVAEFLDMAERELRRVSVITNQTLSFYRQATYPRPVTCEELFDSVLSIFQGRLINSRIEVQKRWREKQPVTCFEGEIRQVLSNLVGNAIDSMMAHGGRLLLRSRRSTDWRSGRKGIVMTVADQGGGISRTDMGKIFEAFFSTKGNEGNGLGLWISQEIVQRHGGVMRVRSSQRSGRSGTVFTLFLPFEADVR